MADELVNENTTADTEESADKTLYDLLLEDLTIDLSKDTNFSADILSVKIKQAIREVKATRKYPSYYTDEKIESDLDNYYNVIRNVALYDYNISGAEGQSSHNENETDRTWVSRDSLFYGVCPISKIN